MKAICINKFKEKSTAFTLAEVLVTLTIIGVIAALTIPALIQNVQDTQYKTAYRQAFSDVNQAFLRAKSNSEFIDNNDSTSNVVTNIRTLEKYFSVTKSCTDSVAQGCWIDNCINGEHDCIYSQPTDNDQAKSEGFTDNSGRAWVHYKIVGYFFMLVDTNGAKGPNRMGRDRFPIYFYDDNNAANMTAPTKIKSATDGITQNPTYCSFGNCYYRSWLKQ